MHLLQAQPGAIDDGAEAVDLGQTPGDVVVLSAADTEIAALAMARQALGDAAPDLRLAQLAHLKHPMSVDLYVAKVITGARLVVGRFLGGTGYWSYAVDEIARACRDNGVAFAALPGDDRADADLDAVSSVPVETCRRLLAYLSEGGPANSARFLRACTAILDGAPFDEPAEPLPRAGLYWPGTDSPDLDTILGPDGARPRAFIVFYRALVQGGATAPVDALINALAKDGIAAVPVHVSSLKDAASQATIETLMADAAPDIVLNLTAFAVGQPGEADGTAAPVRTVLEAGDTPVLQVVMATSSVETWRDSAQGLGPRDIAMHVALPEVDGRVLTRAISFKAGATVDPAVQCAIVRPEPVPDRVGFVARLAANWIGLRRTAPARRRVALVLANYPNRDGRLANGVGLDTPASAVAVLRALATAGYGVADLPADAQALMDRIMAGPTNWLTDRVQRDGGEVLSLKSYSGFLSSLPEAVRAAVTDRWGPPEADPFFDPARGGFVLAILRFGNAVLGVQPARGYQIDPKASYHSPDLVPPHGYLAFHAWLRQHFGAQAVIHLGKHGNLEWLPGKALALSEACFPEAALGPLPNLYPFIVNDPGEGSQAKRRTSAVIVDHLTPPMTRAETYGALKHLEGLVDEYYDAAGLDRRRLDHLKREILSLVRSERLDSDAGIDAGTDDDDAFQRLDNYLCDLKEAQIRDGLHVFGASPAGRQRRDLLVALARTPRRRGAEGDASLLRALAGDLGLGFDPLDCEPATPWTGPRPDLLQSVDDQPWRTAGDTVERLELLAAKLVEALSPHPVPPRQGVTLSRIAHHEPPGLRDSSPPVGEVAAERPVGGGGRYATSDRSIPGKAETPPPLPSPIEGEGAGEPELPLTRTARVLETLSGELAPALDASGAAEMAALLAGLDGRFVAPGPSGAPTRGRPDVLPTGRNFFSIDSRAMPTETAWALGWKSASRLIERHLQVNGDWPRAMALTAWGTSNMRTGGDDIAQALALIGCRPTWEPASRRVTGFEVLPPGVLGRPRVDLTLRISGFFRDAFPTQIDLFDSAVRAVMALDEPEDENPLAAAFRRDRDSLVAGGMDAELAARRAGFRIFGSKPGAYGAGLQALIDERLWESTADFAEAFVAWGQYAYGGGTEGAAEADALRQRLARVEAVVQNQDNREHDLLDSDDYYQFEGGLAATVSHLSGAKPLVWHNDHSRPERPVIRSLEEEIGRVVRARAVNPKWIAGVMRHGYKGAFEMAATVDYLFAFAATTGAVKDHHFDLVEAAYLADDRVRDFIARHNPAALADIAARLDEAIRRGLWHPRANDVRLRLDSILNAPGRDTP